MFGASAMYNTKRCVLHILFEPGQPLIGLPSIPEVDNKRLDDRFHETVIVFTPFDKRMHPRSAGPQADPDELASSPPFSPEERRSALVSRLARHLASGFKHKDVARAGQLLVKLVNVPLAAQWLGYSAEEAESPATIQTDLWMRIGQTVFRDVFYSTHAVHGNPTAAKMMAAHKLSSHDITDLIMAKVEYVSGEEYAAREGVFPEELDIELVPGHRHQLLPKVVLGPVTL